MSGPFDENDDLAVFLQDVHGTIKSAQDLVTSVPNVEISAVEATVRKLYGIRCVLAAIDNPFLTLGEINEMVLDLTNLMEFLERAGAQMAAGSVPPRPRMPPMGQPGRLLTSLDLAECQHLHTLGNSWASISLAVGVSCQTIYNRFKSSGISTSWKEFDTLDDDELDELVSSISLEHPFVGQRIVLGHLQIQSVHVPIKRVQDSLRRVDAVGVLLRWKGIIKQCVYRVRGTNALWHQDGNEKLRPFGFYVHGGIDGHSRLILYLACTSNKRSETVRQLFKEAVALYKWPSRVRGDFGKENNGIEREMVEHWGESHRAYIRGRSTQNVRIECMWWDVRKDTLEVFRQTFTNLEQLGFLDMQNSRHRACLYLVYQPRIQVSLDQTMQAWNNHPIQTAGNKSPKAIYELSWVKAINVGYWHSDAGDAGADTAPGEYGVDPEAPPEEVAEDPAETDGREDLLHRGASVDSDAEIKVAAELLATFDFEEEDGQWGMNVYKRAVRKLDVQFRRLGR